ncbi:unnamed protein product [Effrenium voratum]|uniref:Uncharacterized protein n=1 Tax=Effrenium voratum TaxID=2562239 RepID=A0AA36JB52_9DINO|nr:unnamed protein product [Effrenium voratum]CAJ1422188.1 unnamed protein product [Effrenium voratum]
MRYASVVLHCTARLETLRASDFAQLRTSLMPSSKLSWLPFATGKLQCKAHAVRFFAACLFQSYCPMSACRFAAENALVSVALFFAVSGFDLHARETFQFPDNELG